MTENINILPELSECTYNIGIIRKGNKDKIVEQTLFNEGGSDLSYPIETIHGCKGMSLDAVLFLSSYQAGIGNNGLIELTLEKKTGLHMWLFQEQDIYWHLEYRNQRVFRKQIEKF